MKNIVLFWILFVMGALPLSIAAESSGKEIVFFGDSLTAHHDWQKDFPGLTVINQGVPGETTRRGLVHLKGILRAENPRRIFIMLGINDLYHTPRFKIHPATRTFLRRFFPLKYHTLQALSDAGNHYLWQIITIPEIVANYKTMLFEIRNAWPGTEIFVQTVLPVQQTLFFERTHFRLSYDLIALLNKRLKNLCDEQGITFIDLFPAMTDTRGHKLEYTSDGLHLSSKGYAAWSAVLENRLI